MNKEIIKDMPYTVIGGSSLPEPKRRLVLTGEGIKHLAKLVNNNDIVVYTDWEDFTEEGEVVKHYSKWEIIRKQKKLKEAKKKQ